MKIVRENISFERGKEPKESMKIGKAHEREMIVKQVKDFSGIDLNEGWNWDYQYMNVKGYDAYKIKVIHSDGFNEWMILVPGLHCTPMYSSLNLAKDHAEFNLHGSII